FQGGYILTIPAVRLSPPIDPVGAGDTFISALCLSLAAGATPYEAGQIATFASAVILKKLHQTGTASIGEILEVSHRQMAHQE
ncbi:MAG: carbohydrate kinase, partial [Anaerolineaceae bacterium]|nr:carbohydrate kinase [Anaerolineaceae bacterium]